MTTVYFIRHAESDNSVRDGRTRPLTEKGWKDRRLVTEFLQDKNIDAVVSSPFKRAVDTVAEFAEQNGFEIEIVEDFRERKSDSDWYDQGDVTPLFKRQWEDFTYTLSDGECIAEVQARNIAAFNDVLVRYENKIVAIGTHGMALSTIINYYEKTFGFDEFMAILKITPWVVKMYFNGNDFVAMEKINLHKKFVVIFARYQDKWLYSRAKTRDTFETAGGHIEPGETPLEAAKRELYEETGAVKFDIMPTFECSEFDVKVFFAQIHELGELPDFEMAEVKLFDAIPERTTYPHILPALYDRIQMWLNLQSAKYETWDVYDSERNLTGRTHRRMDPLPKGDYHLVVHVWVQNSAGEFLITRRAPNKGYPNMWECTGGSAVAGDDSLTAAVREVKEETGLEVNPDNGICLFSMKREDSFCDVWLFRQDFDIRDVALQENETIDAKYAGKDEIRRMINDGEFIAFHYIENLFIVEKIQALLKPKTFAHVKAVAERNVQIAQQFGLDENICELCGYLHDISAYIAPPEMMDYTVANGWYIDEAERKYPFLLHQRFSRLIAERDFGITDERILSAVECHSTLKANPSVYDMALFVADKLAWDQEGVSPFYEIVTSAQSLEAASLTYMDYIVAHKMILHPHKWFKEGMNFLKKIEIKQAAAEDIPVIEAILLDTVTWLNEMGQPLWTAEEVTWERLSKSYQIEEFYIAYLDGLPSGCMVIMDYDPFFWPDLKKGESLIVHKLAIVKNARKAGVADALMDFFKQQGTDRGIKTIRLDTDSTRPKLRAFYERHGFDYIETRVMGRFQVAFYVCTLNPTAAAVVGFTSYSQ